MLDLEVSTRAPVVQTSSLAPRRETLNFAAPKAALSGRVMGVDAPRGDSPVMIVALIAVALTLATGVTASFLSAASRGESTKLTAEVAALQGQLRVGPIAEQLKRQQTVAKQLGALTGFLADATPWPAVLDSLSALVPAGTKLTTINIDATKTVRLEGETNTQEEVSTFMAAIDAAEQFDPPRLDSLSLNESVDGSVVLFSIATRYAPEPVAAVPSPAAGVSNDPAVSGPDAESGAPDDPSAATAGSAVATPPPSSQEGVTP